MVDDPNLEHSDENLSEDDASGTLNVESDLVTPTGNPEPEAGEDE
jgi:hypothetical protein